MKTYSAKPKDITRRWFLLDAGKLPLGRLSVIIAELLSGKGKPRFTHHIDTGDYVVVINTKEIVVTGNKMDDKIYYRHSQYPGSLKETQLKDKLSRDPSSVLRKAVKGMLPDNKLREDRLLRLKIYEGNDHNHEAQKPETIELVARPDRRKN